jgi:dipeptidyl aminopeptidase/acylaminoacyl peptidase
MKRQPKRNRTLFLIGLLLALALLFASQNLTRQSPQTAEETAGPVVSLSPDYGKTATYVLSIPTNNITATYRASLPKFPTPIESPATPITPTATSTLQPPQCTFPLAQTEYTEPEPEEYTFSEPQVVLTAAQGNSYNIVQWLPDNQQVLMTEELRNNPDGLESIRLYDPVTGETKVYAIRPITHEPPSWQPELNAIVYPVMNYFDIDNQAGTYKFTRQLWVSYGNPDTAQMLDDNLAQLPLMIDPGGSELIYLSDKKISKRDGSLNGLPSVPFDSAQLDYAEERRGNHPVTYKMAWQPGTSLIFLYSEGAMGGGGYTFILDIDTGHVCELNLGGWALEARWSSDGRYLAIIRVREYAFPFPTSDLTLLDTVTGKLNTLDVTPQEIEQHSVDDFVWAPDGRHIFAIGSAIFSQNSQGEHDIHGMYLIDTVSGQSVPVAPDYQIYVYPADNNLAWSPDGSKVVVRCPTDAGNRICFIPVRKTRQ